MPWCACWQETHSERHLDHTWKTISQAIEALAFVQPYISKVVATTFYSSLIQPLFDHCAIFSDNLSVYQETWLHELKNCAGRVITRQGFNVRSYEIGKELGWKTLLESRDKNKVLRIYKAFNNLAPNYLLDHFHQSKHLDSYIFSDRVESVALSKAKTYYLRNSFVYSGRKLWDSLSKEAKQSTKIKTF